MNKIPVFYNSQMVVDVDLPSPSPKKPKEVFSEWEHKYPIQIKNFHPATLEDFYLIHDIDHVNNILACRKPNGIGTYHKELADSLFWTVGSIIYASKYALQNKIAVSPTSGFHHAGINESLGYCTFNGLMIAAKKLLNENNLNKIGILDCDYHYGNGTQDIIDYYEMENQIIHKTGELHYKRNKFTFFNELNKMLNEFKTVDFLIYQAGADQHENDPYGGFLNNDELFLRDLTVFKFCKNNNIPIVWNLAGGYQEETINGIRNIQKVLDIHNNTMKACVEIYCSAASN